MIFLASSSTRLVELQKMIDWLIWSLAKRVLRQCTCARQSDADRAAARSLQRSGDPKGRGGHGHGRWPAGRRGACPRGRGRAAARLLALLDEGVVLGDALQSELLHQVDLVGLLHELVLEGLDLDGEGRGKEKDLPVGWHEADELLDERLELGREKLVRLVHANHLAFAHFGHPFLRKVEQAPRSAYEQVHRLVQAEDVVLQTRATRAHHHLQPEVLAQVLTDLLTLTRARSQVLQSVCV